MARLLPAALLLGKLDSDFIGGYPTVESIWRYMTQLQTPNDVTLSSGLTKPVGTWEYTLFVGVLAALFILYFGVLRPLSDREAPNHFRVLLLPCLGLTLLSLDKIFINLRSVFPIPLFTGERVSARIISLAFVFILIGATVLFQRWLATNRPTLVRALAMLLLVALAAYDLQSNLRIWSVKNAAKLFPSESFIPSRYFPVNQYSDTPYLTLLAVGLLVSLVSSGALLFLAWREQRIS